MNSHQELAIKALRHMKCDDLARARDAFKNCTPTEMHAEYGQCGRTPAQIIADYESHDAKVDAAIAWTESVTQPDPNLAKALEDIYERTEAHADGAPDANQHDHLCNWISGRLAPFIPLAKR